jgi:hypothetical protein
MLIRYNVTPDDIAAFNRHHFANAPFTRKAKRNWVVISTASTAICIIICYMIQPSALLGSITSLAALIACSMIFSAMYYSSFHLVPRQQIQRLLADPANNTMMGPHALAIDDDGICETTDVGEARRVWTSINRIEETEDYVFIYNTAISAYVIPKHQVTEGDASEFTHRARELLAAANV